MLGNNENIFMGMNIFPVDQCKFGKQVKDTPVAQYINHTKFVACQFNKILEV